LRGWNRLKNTRKMSPPDMTAGMMVPAQVMSSAPR